MDDKELTRLAEQEILRETKLAAERAAVYGALGWMKCPLKPTNKQFLMNTILPTLSTNRKYYYTNKRDYQKADKGECCCLLSRVVLPSTGERPSHRPKKEVVGDSKYPHSNRESDGAHTHNIEGYDNSKESRSHSLDNKIADSRNNADGHKESEYPHHKSSKDMHSSSTSRKFRKDDKHARRINDSLDQHHGKNHHRYNGDMEIKTEFAEARTKSKIVGRCNVSNDSERNVNTDKVWIDSRRLPDANSKLKCSKSSIKDNRVKDELPYYTGTDRNGHLITESPWHSKNNRLFDNKDLTSGIDNNRSISEKDKDKKIIRYSSEYSQHSIRSEKAKKSTRKLKRDNSSKLKDRHSDDRQRLKKKRCKTSSRAVNNIKAGVSNNSSAKIYKLGKEKESVKHDAGSSKKKRTSSGDNSKSREYEHKKIKKACSKRYKILQTELAV